MSRGQVQRKQTNSDKTKSDDINFDVHEFYVLEKLYEAMRKDKKNGKVSSSDR